jgi:hypothetical protein
VDALTIACIEHAETLNTHQLDVTQGSYQGGNGDPNSAGTHDLGGVVDFAWCGHDACVRALREAGMAAWHRSPAQGPWPDHIHAVVLDHPALAPSAAAQVIAYLSGRNGLATNSPDDGPRISPIPRPVWPWPQEETVTPEDIDQIADRVVEKLLAASASSKPPTTVKAALRLSAEAARITKKGSQQ